MNAKAANIAKFEPKTPVAGKKFKTGHVWEMDAEGWHRIVNPDGTIGDWALYQGIAISSDGKYLCVSQYYGCLPEQVSPKDAPDILSETLYEITPVEAAP